MLPTFLDILNKIPKPMPIVEIDVIYSLAAGVVNNVNEAI